MSPIKPRMASDYRVFYFNALIICGVGTYDTVREIDNIGASLHEQFSLRGCKGFFPLSTLL